MMASYQAVTDDVGKLREDELARPSRCQGWSRADLLFHLLLDAQRALVTFATSAAGEPDVDFLSYWVPFRPGAEGHRQSRAHGWRPRQSGRARDSLPAAWMNRANRQKATKRLSRAGRRRPCRGADLEGTLG